MATKGKSKTLQAGNCLVVLLLLKESGAVCGGDDDAAEEVHATAIRIKARRTIRVEYIVGGWFEKVFAAS